MANIISKSGIINSVKNIPKLPGNRTKVITEEIKKNKKSSLERSGVKIAQKGTKNSNKITTEVARAKNRGSRIETNDRSFKNRIKINTSKKKSKKWTTTKKIERSNKFEKT